MTRPWRAGAVGACPPGYQRLGATVLRAAFDDARCDGATGERARAWLRGDSERLRLWTALAGVCLDQVRRQLARIEAQRRAAAVHAKGAA